METHFSYTINIEEKGKTIEQFLRGKGFTHHLIARMKRVEDGICHNGERAYTTAVLSPGDVLTVHLTEESRIEKILPVRLDFTTVYEDEDILVINKPAGMPVHPSMGNYENTLANAVRAAYPQDEPFVFRCINRLDRDTTGLLVLARHPLSGAVLSRAMKERQIHRTYLAVVSGCPEPAEGCIDAPIARKEGSTIERCVDAVRGEQAITRYQVICPGESYSLVALRLQTGRTHQIRVHMKYIGHPLPGDFLYHPDFSAISRQPLHSAGLAFAHPSTGEWLEFSAPLPEDMRRMLETKGQKLPENFLSACLQ